MFVALSGCVITDQRDRMVTYVKKCENCGYVLPGKATMGGGGGTSHSSFQCPKCKKRVEIAIKWC